MSWNDKLSYQENLDIFVDSLKDYSKDENGKYKIVKELVNVNNSRELKSFRKNYASVAKRVNKDLNNMRYEATPELVSISYKGEVFFSFKPARYVSITNILRTLQKNINNKELQIRDYRDSLLGSALDNDLVKKVEMLQTELLSLYEKQGIIQEVHNSMNDTDKYNEELKGKKSKLNEARIIQLDLNKQMKEYFSNKDISSFKRIAKELAELNVTGLEKEIMDLKKERVELNDVIVARLPEIVVNEQKELKKKKKTVKKKKAKVGDDKGEEAPKLKKKKKTEKKDKIEKEAVEEKVEKTVEDEKVVGKKTESESKMKGGFNLLEQLSRNQGSSPGDEFDKKEEFSMNLGDLEQFGSAVLSEETKNDDMIGGSTLDMEHSETFNTPPFSPSNPNTPEPAVSVPVMEMNGGNANDIKVVSIKGNVGDVASITDSQVPNNISSVTPEPTGGAYSQKPNDPFGDLELNSVDMSGAGYEDMTQTINHKMEGGSYGGGDVFGSTYSSNPSIDMTTQGADPFGLNATPSELVNVNVTKLGA